MMDLYNDPRRIPMHELQKNMFGIIRSLEHNGDRKLITRGGKVVAILASLTEMSELDSLAKKN